MKATLIRTRIHKENEVEFLFEVDEKFMKFFKDQTRTELTTETFNTFVNEAIDQYFDGEDWKY